MHLPLGDPQVPQARIGSLIVSKTSMKRLPHGTARVDLLRQLCNKSYVKVVKDQE